MNSSYYFDVTYISASPDEDSFISTVAGPFWTLARPDQMVLPVLAAKTSSSLNVSFVAPLGHGATIIGFVCNVLM